VNVVLVGYRGTGKSTVARHVARSLGLEVFSLDAEIQRAAGTSIPHIVAERGWDEFRDIEEEICRRVAAEDGHVIDCGGGVVEREANYPVLRGAGPVIWLQATPATIVRRIGGDDQRPSLTGAKSFTEEVEEVLARRTPRYRALAHYSVSTDEVRPETVAERIVAWVRATV
jgi:shikimate kinase